MVVCTDLVVCLEYPEFRAKEVGQENEDLKGQWVCPDFQEKMVLLGLMDSLDRGDIPVFRVSPDNQAAATQR